MNPHPELHLTEAPPPVSSASQIGVRDTLSTLFTETEGQRRISSRNRPTAAPSTLAWMAIGTVSLLVAGAIFALFVI